jgi:hypothetical protein
VCGVDSAASTQKQVSELAAKLREQHSFCGLSVLHSIPALSSQKRVQGLRCSSINKGGAPYLDPKRNDSEAAAAVSLTPLTPAVYSLNHNVANTPIEGSRTKAVSVFHPALLRGFVRKIACAARKVLSRLPKLMLGTGNALSLSRTNLSGVEDHYSLAARKDLH